MSIVLGRRHRLLHVRALLAKRNTGEQEICPVHYGSALDSQLLHKERATARYGKKPGDQEYYIANSLKKKCKKLYLGIHDRFIRDEKFRKNIFDIGRTEEICREMDKIGVRRPHAPHHSRRNSCVQKTIGGFRSNTVGSDTMSVRHRPDFKQASIANPATAQR